jgi:hypothetical protein
MELTGTVYVVQLTMTTEGRFTLISDVSVPYQWRVSSVSVPSVQCAGYVRQSFCDGHRTDTSPVSVNRPLRCVVDAMLYQAAKANAFHPSDFLNPLYMLVVFGFTLFLFFYSFTFFRPTRPHVFLMVKLTVNACNVCRDTSLLFWIKDHSRNKTSGIVHK